MRTRRPLWIALTAALMLTAACRPVSLATGGEGIVTASDRYALHGTVAFADRTAQIAPSVLTSLATVALIDTTGKTLASVRTDGAGAFTLLPGASFGVADGDVFYLDAYKGTNGNAVGSDVARLRTILQWTNTGWKSTSVGAVVINPLTTAVAVIQGLQSGSVTAVNTLNTVNGATVTTGNPTLNGNWSAVNGLVIDMLAKDQDPLSRIVYRDAAFRIAANKATPVVLENFRAGTLSNTQLDAAGKLRLEAPRPTPNDPASDIETFQAAGIAPNSAGSVASDGTYLYVKAWSTFGLNTPTNAIIKKIGTGFNGTTRGANYGTLGSAPPANTISIAYYQGNLYLPLPSNTSQLFQISTTTGATATIEIPVSLWSYDSSKTVGGAPLITCDGRYIYNLTSTIETAAHGDNGFLVQILDPAQGFKLVRKFTLDTTSFYTDGIYCDGTYLWPMEWTGANTGNIRRYRLADGVREAAWTFQRNTPGYAQNVYQPELSNPINGCWDPYNRVFWIGELTNERIHLLRGGSFIPSGTWTSGNLDAGTVDPYYGRLSWKADLNGADGLSFQVRSAATTGALATATWYGPTGTSDAYTQSGTPLNPIHNKNRYFQIRATFTSADLRTSPTLSQISAEVLP